MADTRWDRDGDQLSNTGAVDLPSIPGTLLDPPPRNYDATRDKLDERHISAGVMFRTWHRFIVAKAPLLAAGTTYYLFLSAISLVAFAYGTIALIGADPLADWLTAALNNAFPGLIGADGVSPDALRSYGTTASILGLLVLAVAGTSSVFAANQSLHLIYGVSKDPRNIVLVRMRMLGVLLLLGPLVLLSFVPALLVTTFAEPIQDRLGLQSAWSVTLLSILTYGISLGMNFLVVYLALGWLGGVRPPAQPRRIGALAGAVVVELLKYAMAGIIAWSLSRPKYGAFAVPITIMLVLYLLSTALYASACLTAAIALKQAQDAAKAGTADAAVLTRQPESGGADSTAST